MVFGDYPRVVGREPGPGTMTGEGDMLIGSDGKRYRIISSAEADLIRSGTAGDVRTLHHDGTIR